MALLFTVVGLTLDYDDKAFVQTTEIYSFSKQVLVSWNPTPDQPRPGDGWIWLADNTLRIAHQDTRIRKKYKYTTEPVIEQPDGQLIYNWEWSSGSVGHVVHLCLPNGFIADLNSFSNGLPTYAKWNVERVCFGWLYPHHNSIEYSFRPLKVDSDFEIHRQIFFDHYEALKTKGPLVSKIAQARELSKIYTFRLQELEKKIAIYGEAAVPVYIKYEFEETQQALQKQQDILNQWRNIQQ